MKIILDLGSGETCKNETHQVRKMIEAIDKVDNRKHEIILKWQLFREWGELIPLHEGIFTYAYLEAEKRGYVCTASVFDTESAKFLKIFPVPFVKLACVPEVYNSMPIVLIDFGWWEKPIVLSIPDQDEYRRLANVPEYKYNVKFLCCVRAYPADVLDYFYTFGDFLPTGISDHTDHTKGFELVEQYKPEIYETHFCLDEQTGPDTGVHALRPAQLAELLEAV